MTRKPAHPPIESLLPLPTATFDILLALAGEERHGYAIMKEIEERTDGAGKIGAGTLYGALKRLLAAGIVEETERHDPDQGDERRRYYKLTGFGVEVAKAEALRLDRVVRDARRKKLVGRIA